MSSFLIFRTFFIIFLSFSIAICDHNATLVKKSSSKILYEKVSSIIGWKQSVGVRGKLTCADEPLVNATVKLWDNDMFDPDDLMAETRTDSTGAFELKGSTTSTSTIDPQLRIYHTCLNSASSGCKRRITFNIPVKYINTGKMVNNWLQLGTLNMEIGVKYKEDSQCF